MILDFWINWPSWLSLRWRNGLIFKSIWACKWTNFNRCHFFLFKPKLLLQTTFTSFFSAYVNTSVCPKQNTSPLSTISVSTLPRLRVPQLPFCFFLGPVMFLQSHHPMSDCYHSMETRSHTVYPRISFFWQNRPKCVWFWLENKVRETLGVWPQLRNGILFLHHALSAKVTLTLKNEVQISTLLQSCFNSLSANVSWILTHWISLLALVISIRR